MNAAETGDAADAGERDILECARLSAECRICHRPVVLTEGYEAEPEDGR